MVSRLMCGPHFNVIQYVALGKTVSGVFKGRRARHLPRAPLEVLRA